MSTYNVELTNDMGHLVANPDYSYLPQHIYSFVFEKAKMYINCRITNHGTRSYKLKPGLNKKWIYECGSDKVVITYNVY